MGTTIDPAPPVRVAHVITRLIVGGAQENTIYTAARLESGRYQVQVICGPQTGSEGSLLDEAVSTGIDLMILPSLLRQVSPLNDLRSLVALVRTFRRERFAIVHTHSSKAGILGRLAAWIARTPVIIHTVHGWSFHEYMHPVTRWVYIHLERWMAQFTDALIAVAEHDIHKGLEAGIGSRQQYALIRSAIPLAEFNPATIDREQVQSELNLGADHPIVGFIGRFSPQKNPLDWIRVARQIGNANPRARFLLVGDGPMRTEVERLLAQEGLSGRAILTGLRRDVPRLFSVMNVFLLTSLWEGLPRVLPQAMAMELPIVATLTDGTAEAVRNGITGYLCQTGDLECLASRCLELLADPELRSEFGRRGRQVALDEFNLEDMIAEIDRLYVEQMRKKGLEPANGPI